MSIRTIRRVPAAMASALLIFIGVGCGSSTTGSDGSAADTASLSPSSVAPPSSPVPPGTTLGPTNSSGTQLPQVGSYEEIAVGDCFDFPTVRVAVERSCDEPHDAEMFVTDAPTGLDAIDAKYPPHEQWQELSATLCYQPFADYTGQSIDETTGLSMSLLYPLEPDWSDVSRRTLSCAIVSIDGTPLQGSKHA
jgi:hypothetical protein